ncbi:MAG: hypothetical protein WD872_17055 [Pirellulaceae bacterium]
MSRPAFARKQLTLEKLEDRVLMAGNVVAVQTGGTLTLRGDHAANSASIVYDNASRTHRVVGHDLGGSPTTVNGGAAAAQFAGVKNVRAWLGGGDDKLDFGAADQLYAKLDKKLSIDMGDGNDTLELGRAGNGAGGAAPIASRLYVNKGIWVHLGAGNDQLKVANLKTNKSLIVLGGDGNDAIQFATEFTAAGATQPTYFPVNIKGNLHLHLGAGDDTLSLLHALVGDHLKVHDPAGTSNITIVDVAINENLTIHTAGGSDQVTLDYVGADQLAIRTGDGADDVEIEHGRFKRLSVKTEGAGDDLKIRTTRSSQYAYLDGGQGNNDLSHGGNKLRGLVNRRFG